MSFPPCWCQYLPPQIKVLQLSEHEVPRNFSQSQGKDSHPHTHIPPTPHPPPPVSAGIAGAHLSAHAPRQRQGSPHEASPAARPRFQPGGGSAPRRPWREGAAGPPHALLALPAAGARLPVAATGCPPTPSPRRRHHHLGVAVLESLTWRVSPTPATSCQGFIVGCEPPLPAAAGAAAGAPPQHGREPGGGRSGRRWRSGCPRRAARPQPPSPRPAAAATSEPRHGWRQNDSAPGYLRRAYTIQNVCGTVFTTFGTRFSACWPKMSLFPPR